MSQPLWKDGPVLHQAPDVFPLGTDSILLADFARPGKADRILDLGTGGGTLPVLMGFGRPDLWPGRTLRRTASLRRFWRRISGITGRSSRRELLI